MKISEYFVEATRSTMLYKASIKAEEIWEGDWMGRKDQYHTVHIKHLDGSEFKVRFCFIRWGKLYKSNYEVLITIPEHTPVSYYHLDDLEYVKIENNKGKLKTIVKMIMPKGNGISTYKIYKYE